MCRGDATMPDEMTLYRTFLIKVMVPVGFGLYFGESLNKFSLTLQNSSDKHSNIPIGGLFCMYINIHIVRQSYLSDWRINI